MDKSPPLDRATDTPRVDDLVRPFDRASRDHDELVALARQLERECAAWRALAEKDYRGSSISAYVKEMEQELAATDAFVAAVKGWLRCSPNSVSHADLRYSPGVISLLGDDREWKHG